MTDLTKYIEERARLAKRAAVTLAHLATAEKNRFLEMLATALLANQTIILVENAKDIEHATAKGLSTALIDRLRLTPDRIEEMAVSVKEIMTLDDPVGQVVKRSVRPNGLTVERVRIPLGVIAMIYEARPNVTIDAASLCFKSGNAVVLRGGSEAIHSNLALAKILRQSSEAVQISPEWVQLIRHTDRKTIPLLGKQVGLVDLIIPRGGEGLMRFVDEHSRVPVLKHDKGVCSIYVDDKADEQKAVNIIVNAKVQRPGVCNAVENIWIHEEIAEHFLPVLAAILQKKGVEIRGDNRVRKILPRAKPATAADWTTEYLDLIVSIGIVKDLHAAIAKIEATSSLHTEAIVTEDRAHADMFLNRLNSSCVLWNASTRFNDGGQLGLGAEIGISTTKLHAFGPMGLEELTTTKFVVRGTGQVRS